MCLMPWPSTHHTLAHLPMAKRTVCHEARQVAREAVHLRRVGAGLRHARGAIKSRVRAPVHGDGNAGRRNCLKVKDALLNATNRRGQAYLHFSLTTRWQKAETGQVVAQIVCEVKACGQTARLRAR